MDKERILVVEDEEIVRESLTRVLARAGFATDGVPSAEAGLARLLQARYDLLLADLKMPHMDGITFLKEAKRRDPEVEAVIITGYGTIEHAVEAMELGAQGFVVKPVAPDRLLAVVEEALSRIRSSREVQRVGALTPLLDLSRTIFGEPQTEKVISTFFDIVAQQTRVERAAVEVWDPEGKNLSLLQSRGMPPTFDGLSDQAGWQLWQRCRQGLEPFLVREGAASWLQLTRDLTQAGFAQGVCCPMTLQRELLGVVLLSPQGADRSFTRSDLEFLELASGLLAMTLRNIQLTHQLPKHTPGARRGRGSQGDRAGNSNGAGGSE